jgi:hypothetical protein
VLNGFHSLEGCVKVCDASGLAVVKPAAPLHYYSIFSRTIGQDVVLTMYPGNKYEVESKYIQYVQFHSRGVWPRLDYAPLVKVRKTLS